MKITVSLSQSELLSILSAHYGGIKIDEVCIQDDAPAPKVEPKARIYSHEDYGHFQVLGVAYRNMPNKKIEWIKSLRAVLKEFGFNYGLGYSKFAVENWDNFLSYLYYNKRAPKEIYSNGRME